MVDIEINAWSSLFLNLETNLILYLFPENCIKFNQSESRIQKREELYNFEKPVFDFSVLYSKKSGLSKKLKVSTLDIRIKQSGSKVSYSKVPSSVLLTPRPIKDETEKYQDCCAFCVLGSSFLKKSYNWSSQSSILSLCLKII